MKALYASHNQILYQAEIFTLDHIAELSRGGSRIETLTSTEHAVVFWFNTHDHCRQIQARANRRATALLLATTNFTARNVPLLRGDVVLTGRDADGNPADLTDTQIDRLIHAETPWLDDLYLSRRLNHDRRCQLRQARRVRALQSTTPF
ncbi:hypothetical protein FIV07_27910 (plasmid) [Mycobacterium sp. THAF192]|nr:hypothetical protein FIV07_27910 [Mycobacterium sp. THAF192]